MSISKKLVEAVSRPGSFLSTMHNRLLPKDVTAGRIASWKYGDLPRRPITEVFPGLESTDVTVLRPFDRLIGMSLDVNELVYLAALVKITLAESILEIGTYDGNTALNLAANAVDGAVVTTVDLPIEWDGSFEVDVPREMVNAADRRVVGRQYKGTRYEPKIRQVLCDSAKIDWSTMATPFDIAFIDGCHTYEYVKIDTANAVRYVRQGGLIVWHDYGEYADVSRAVDETAERFRIEAIRGTRLAIGFTDQQPV